MTNNPSTTRWPAGNVHSISSCTRDGRLATITPSIRRKRRRNGTKVRTEVRACLVSASLAYQVLAFAGRTWLFKEVSRALRSGPTVLVVQTLPVRLSIHHLPAYLPSCRRRKKKCIRYSEGGDQPNGGHDRDNLGSVGSTEAQTPDSKSANEDSDDADLNMSSAELSLSSPPVPSNEHLLLSASRNHSNHFQASRLDHRSSQSTTSSSSLASLQGPPRNSPIGPNNPLSIEQLTRPHLPRPAAV